ncbi:MAG: hypothetical protein KatS3mg014_2425 [Actinomycetota bacterium]|nr:MAG: hypothetical protein KatS3mg014_2425 [Actinomycetota bacterium]
MARAEDAPARLGRLAPAASVAALAAATALAFGRVFVGRAPTARLLLAALLAVAIGWATERRGLLVATLASALGLLVALTWLVFPQTAWYGLPSPRTLRAIERSLAVVGQQTRSQVSPAPPFPPLLMAAVTAVWTACSSAHTLAARAGSPMLALLPPVALVAFADLVLEDGVRPGYAALLILAALAVALADGLRRIRRFGPLVVRPGARPPARARRSPAGRGGPGPSPSSPPSSRRASSPASAPNPSWTCPAPAAARRASTRSSRSTRRSRARIPSPCSGSPRPAARAPTGGCSRSTSSTAPRGG